MEDQAPPESPAEDEDDDEYVGILEGGWDDLPPELLALLKAFRLSCEQQNPPREESPKDSLFPAEEPAKKPPSKRRRKR
ncbi:MAG: hypothetical protein JNK25_03065 [Phycisphaerae bacterium]|nr:hypothetical protein [Phycisphaerae bacterium]